VALGELDGLLKSLAKFSEKLRVVEAVRETGLTARTTRQWGPALVFGRLWERQGLPDQFRRLALQHFYRTAAFLAGVRQDLESRLFHRDLNLCNQTLDVVFIDTTSLYCYRGTETEWRRRGYSRDHRPDLPQWVLCVAVNATGWPIAWEIFPDQKALGQVVALLRQRFQIRRVTVVADRGMISRDTITMLIDHQEAPFDYVLGCRMRRQKEVNAEVLARAGRYQPVAANLEVKEVRVGGRRYVVCRNPQEAARNAAARDAILDKLRQKVAKQGPKVVVAKGSVSIDEDAVQRDARLDGKFVLTANTDLPTAEVAQTYKSLWRVERTFREQKSTLEVRPIYTSETTPPGATSWPRSWPCAWKWTCNNAWMTVRSRFPGPS
jgi:hypothetical protein